MRSRRRRSATDRGFVECFARPRAAPMVPRTPIPPLPIPHIPLSVIIPQVIRVPPLSPPCPPCSGVLPSHPHSPLPLLPLCPLAPSLAQASRPSGPSGAPAAPPGGVCTASFERSPTREAVGEAGILAPLGSMRGASWLPPPPAGFPRPPAGRHLATSGRRHEGSCWLATAASSSPPVRKPHHMPPSPCHRPPPFPAMRFPVFGLGVADPESGDCGCWLPLCRRALGRFTGRSGRPLRVRRDEPCWRALGLWLGLPTPTPRGLSSGARPRRTRSPRCCSSPGCSCLSALFECYCYCYCYQGIPRCTPLWSTPRDPPLALDLLPLQLLEQQPCDGFIVPRGVSPS